MSNLNRAFDIDESKGYPGGAAILSDGTNVLDNIPAIRAVNSGIPVDLYFYARVNSQSALNKNPTAWIYYLKTLSFSPTGILIEDWYGTYQLYHINL
jgi:hypothetical protein